MALSQSARRTRAHNTRRHPARRLQRRTPRLPAIRIGWAITAAFTVTAAAKTWPTATLAVLALATTAVLIGVWKPQRLAGLRARIGRLRAWNARRHPALPASTLLPLATFERMTPPVFERAIAELAVRNKDEVHSAAVHGGANDRGLDVLVHLRDGRRILIQCKRYIGSNKVSSEDVQKVSGTWKAIHGCDLAVIVTTSGFTRSAVETNLLLNPRIRLMDGTALVEWANGGTPPWR